MHGIGVLDLVTGEKFVGNFVDGKVEGLGTFYRSNNNKYENAIYGEWKDNKL